ncbi:MAG: hypothetical protein K2F59_02440 [Eubacteriales bacterium]|nr:hypothetical protein [Eubacteriales bacterium]
MRSELEKFNKIFENIEENKRYIVQNLIENAVFMAVELKKLQKIIRKNGCTETYQNGNNQYGKKKSSEVEVYNSMIKNYSSVIKQLTDLLPNGNNTQDELMALLGRD